MTPDQLLFAKTHEWVHVASEGGAKVATVGISSFAVEALTDLVFLGLPDVGRKLAAGEVFGEVESVKAVSDLYTPVTGEVIAVNGDLANHLEWLGQDPYGRGWLVKIRIADESGLKQLLDHAAYERQCAEEGH